jgi:hypothetical protein
MVESRMFPTMKCTKGKITLVILLITLCSPSHSEEKRYFVPAVADVFISNLLVFGWNRFLWRSPFAMISWESTVENLHEHWEWDKDIFATNQFGHPYHGSTYHVGAIANGFSFYEAILFDAFGSATYEMFAETTPPSLNDFIFTTIGGASLGEVFHRLYLEVDFPLMLILSPADGVNSLITGRRPERGFEKMRSFSASSGAGWIRSEYYGAKIETQDSWDLPAMHVEFQVIYGDPFTAESRVPYDQFEMTVDGGIGDSWWNMRIVSDGYLFSSAPLYTETEQLSTGLSLSYDFFTSLNIDFFSQGLNWAVKYRRSFSSLPNTDMEIKAHAGWLGFGASNFYAYDKIEHTAVSYRDYGTGTNAKLFFSLSHPRVGKFSVELLSYAMFIVSHEVPGSAGWDFCNFFTVSHHFPLPNNFFLGIANTLSIKNGRYPDNPGVDKFTNSLRLYLGWSFDGPAARGR